MARVLLVEDEDRYRDVVSQVLTRRGHEVFSTASGNEAVELGSRLRPQVLVADWMLRHSIHGLHVAEALRVVDPKIHTVIVTGFPSTDLQVDLRRIGVVDLLEKPFDLDVLDSAVERAAASEEVSDSPEVVGVLVVDEEGRIEHRNLTARLLLEETKAGAEASTLADIFDTDSAELLRTSNEGWVRVSPDGSHGTSWWLRSRSWSDGPGRLILFCAAIQEWRRDDARVRTLLGQRLGGDSRWELEDRLLLIDDSRTVRETFVTQLRSRGCTAFASESHEEGLKVFAADPKIHVVVLDWAMPGEDLRSTVAQLREIRPEVTLIGTSGEDRHSEFRELGIDAFLQKPWTVAGDLAALLGGVAERRVIGSHT